MAKNTFYITTAIDYVNAKPHIGHAYEKIIADAIARYNRLQGKKVLFLTGTDENASKNAQAAKEENIPTKEFVDRNAQTFIELCKTLNISNNDFIRTTEQRHIKKAQSLFQQVYDKEDIYKGLYEGLYCEGCEEFKTEKDLIDKKCPEHPNRKIKKISEEAYFFKLSKYQKKIVELLKNDLITPQTRANEIISRLESEPLRDLCVSRTNLDWGIDSPIDKKFKIYVWFDALVNYLTAAGKKEEFWPADVHVIGKGINWFHSVIWPAILFSSNYKPPKKILVHGYLTVNGQKMSKSLGNVIDPTELAKKYPTDSIRYFLLREIPINSDGDFSERSLIERHNNELANKLGNLVSRVSALAEKYGLEKTKSKKLDSIKLIKNTINHFENLELDKALNEIFSYIDECNEYIQSTKPWETQDKKVLYELSNAIKDISILISPFIPESSDKISKIFNFEISLKSLKTPLKISKIKKAEPLFTKIELKEEIKDKLKENKNEKLNKTHSIEGIMTTIDYKDWEKIELKIGKIENIEDIDGADKLYKLTVNLGKEKKTICAGIKEHYSKDQLKNKKVVVFANLAPRKMRGIESQGMLLAAISEDESQVILLSPEKDIEEGSKIR